MQRRSQIPVPSWDDIMFGADNHDGAAAPPEERAAATPCSCTCHEVEKHSTATEIEQRILSALDTFERVDFARLSDTLDRMNAQLDRWEKREDATASTTAYLRIQLQALASSLGDEQ